MPQINEIHYDNAGDDVNEFIEIRVPAGYNMDNLQVVLYNGSDGQPYNTQSVGSGLAVDSGDGYAYMVVSYPQNGIQNGSPDGVALVDNGTLIEFLSYEGSFTASGGPADGETSTNIGVFEPNNAPIGSSLQKTPGGTWYYTENRNTEGSRNECFLKGTSILTVEGYKMIETLSTDDLILDHQGASHKVVWIGRQTIDPVANHHQPIRIAAHSLGENRPMNDLIVSQGHALYLDGLLINAGALVNGTTVCEVEMNEPYEYYHVELNVHTAITAEGIHAESYLPQHEDRSLYDNADTYHGSPNVLLLPMNAPRVTSAIRVPQHVADLLDDTTSIRKVS